MNPGFHAGTGLELSIFMNGWAYISTHSFARKIGQEKA
jgi:hypothetical protein